MSSIFWLTTIFAILFLLIRIFVKKDYFCLNTYILVGIYLPLLMSNFNWSFLHVADKPNIFYTFFSIFNLFAIIFNFLPQKVIRFENINFIKNKRILPVEIYNLIYIISIMVENYYASGYVFPSFHGIDIHTARMPYIYFITTGIYLFSILNLFEYFSTKKKKYIIYICIMIAFNIVTKSARIDAFICIIQLVSIFLVYYFYNKTAKIRNEKKIVKRRKKTPIIILAVIILIFITNIGLKVGNNRMNSYGKYNISYTDGIGFEGPFKDNAVIGYYYGYFPLSFDNLAYNMKFTKISPNYIGLSTFRALYFGILQFDNLFDLDGGTASKANSIRAKAAAVATGFWDFYYDYEDLFFIPIVVSFILYYYLKYKITRHNPSALSIAVYFYWIPLWTFLSFDNRIYDYQVLMHIILMAIIIPKRYILSINQNNN